MIYNIIRFIRQALVPLPMSSRYRCTNESPVTLTAGLSGPSVFCLMDNASCRRLPASLYFPWSLSAWRCSSACRHSTCKTAKSRRKKKTKNTKPNQNQKHQNKNTVIKQNAKLRRRNKHKNILGQFQGVFKGHTTDIKEWRCYFRHGLHKVGTLKHANRYLWV